MRHRELKRILKEVYPVEPSRKGKAFIKAHRKRELHLMDILGMQLKFMGPASFLAAAAVFGIFFLLFQEQNPEQLWDLSLLMPVAALFAMMDFWKSERFGMREMEMSCRFSTRFIRAARLFISGAGSLMLFLSLVPVVYLRAGISLGRSIFYLGFPYLLTVWGCLWVCRKWHDRQNIYGCIAVAVLSGLLQLLKPVMLSGSICLLLMSGVCLLTAYEMRLLFQEREENQWNWC